MLRIQRMHATHAGMRMHAAHARYPYPPTQGVCYAYTHSHSTGVCYAYRGCAHHSVCYAHRGCASPCAGRCMLRMPPHARCTARTRSACCALHSMHTTCAAHAWACYACPLPWAPLREGGPLALPSRRVLREASPPRRGLWPRAALFGPHLKDR